MSDSDQHDPKDTAGGLTGKHARQVTPEVSQHATEEARELQGEQGEKMTVEEVDKSVPPDANDPNRHHGPDD